MPQLGQNEDTAAVLAIERENRAVLLYCSGMTMAEVAKEIGYNDSSAASKAVNRALKKRAEATFAARDELIARHMEVIRLCIRGQMPEILKGNTRAVEVTIKALEREAKMLGIDAPVKADVKITDALTAEIAELVESMASLDATEQVQLLARERG